MMKMKNPTTHTRKKFSFSFLISISTVIVICLGPSGPGYAAQLKTIQEAQQAVDTAWEVYHDAALSGTLATPDIQDQIESDLQKARGLLTQARDAEESEPSRLDDLLKKIGTLTQKIVAASRKEKP